MGKAQSLVVSVSSMGDIDLIKPKTKYINIDITNCSHEVIDFFIKNGKKYLYSDVCNGVMGYIYVEYNDFFLAESFISNMYSLIPSDLSELEKARYLYVSLARYVFFDINIVPEKNENCNFSLTSKINNLWGSLSQRRVTSISISKIYYYLCKRLCLNVELIIDKKSNEAYNLLKIENSMFNVDIFHDIPYIQAKMVTKNFTPYNDDLNLDKKVGYIKSKYNDSLIDKALKHIDYTNEFCIEEILSKTQAIVDVDNIKPVELGIIYGEIFKKYCPNYNVKINNLFLNNRDKSHFIMISYAGNHYSYNYKKCSFVLLNNSDILDNINDRKIGLYLNEFIPNLEIN